MEFFQNIWTLLNSENADFAQIVAYIFGIFDVIMPLLFFILLLDLKLSRKHIIIYIIVSYLFGICANIFIPSPFSSYISILVTTLLIKFLFKQKLIISVIAQFIQYAIFTIVAIIIHNIYIFVFGITTEVFTVTPIHRIILSIILYSSLYLIYRLAKYFKLNLYTFNYLKEKLNLTLSFNLIFGIIAFGVQVYMSSLYSDYMPFYITLINLGVLLVYLIFSMYSLVRTASLERTKQNLEQTQQYNKTLTIMHDNIRAFKHDFNNIITTLGGYVQTDDMVGLKKYYSELLIDCNKTNNLSALSPSVVNEPAIYSLLTNKYYLADEKGININLDVFMDLSKLNMKTYEFARILRNIIR